MSDPIANLQQLINSSDDIELLTFDQPVKSVDQAVKVSGLSREQIIKTIIMESAENDYIAAIVPAKFKVDPLKLDEVVDDWKLASFDKVKEITGFDAGAVPPIGLPDDMNKLVDPNVVEESIVIGGGGDIFSLIKLPPTKILEEGAEIQVIISE